MGLSHGEMTQPFIPASRPSAALPGGIDSWIFDLDNTLYPASSSLFPQIDFKMRAYIARLLDLSLDDAFRLQKQYYRDYGTTLRGLMAVHGVLPEAFLDYVHDIDHSVLEPAPRLAAALKALPGRRIIYTNGSEKHALAVLDRLGLGGCFEAIFDIAAAGYLPKPERSSYDALIARHRIDPVRAVLVEDIARNLAPAAEIGMTTVLVRDPGAPSWGVGPDGDLSFIDHVTEDLAGWLKAAALS